MPMDLDDLMKRHARGERSPELLKALDQLAWEAFHAPWEPKPDAQQRAEHEAPPSALSSRADLLPWMGQAGQELLQRGWAVALEARRAAPRVSIRPDPEELAVMLLEAAGLLIVPGSAVLAAAEALRGWNQSPKGTLYPAALRPAGRRARNGLAPHELGLTGRIRILDPQPDPGLAESESPDSGETLADTVMRFQIATEDLVQLVKEALRR